MAHVLDSFRPDGRAAVVTGGNRGPGRAFNKALSEAGAPVAQLLFCLFSRSPGFSERSLRE